MKFITDFQKDKNYNYKTYSRDGEKIVEERNVRFLFSYAGKYQHLMFNHFLDRSLTKFEDYKGDMFGNIITDKNLNKIKKNINDKRCRYILCEEEVVTYTVTGKVFSKKSKVTTYDKTSDLIGKIKSGKLDQTIRIRTMYKKRVDGVSVFIPGAMVSLRDINDFRSSYGHPVKMFDSLNITKL
ncbi:MAG: hypothetical protein SLAVMIC_00589 [uncultured marine phage]|uniref:Uncharacterized protein n=1 Tax=uncultured marine phage TaxID=707152 RepID=A0A8D9C964_9VIRU|nr:MAG: hypothetical protein SLAVMIC_00589 [uncultured marine phage]